MKDGVSLFLRDVNGSAWWVAPLAPCTHTPRGHTQGQQHTHSECPSSTPTFSAPHPQVRQQRQVQRLKGLEIRHEGASGGKTAQAAAVHVAQNPQDCVESLCTARVPLGLQVKGGSSLLPIWRPRVSAPSACSHIN